MINTMTELLVIMVTMYCLGVITSLAYLTNKLDKEYGECINNLQDQIKDLKKNDII